MKQYPDSLTGYSVSLVERAQNTDLPQFNMTPSIMPILNYNHEDAIAVSHHTLVFSETEDESIWGL